MPLLKKKPFKRLEPPAGLEPDDEVFFCEATKEVFRDYDSFFQRTILCNSLVWSCSVTGKGKIKRETMSLQNGNSLEWKKSIVILMSTKISSFC